MIYHVLNGDCLHDQLTQAGITGEYIVCRECLIEGPLEGENPDRFFEVRANYIAVSYHENTEGYYQKVVNELNKLKCIPAGAEINLWFEHDLFCQANMWFIISLLKDYPAANIYRLSPTIHHAPDLWKGFGMSGTSEIQQSLSDRVAFTKKDIETGVQLWKAYQSNDLEKLAALATEVSPCYPYLNEVCRAHLERFSLNGKTGRPERVISEIMQNKTMEFHEVFSAFSAREGIYGFSDLQVKRLFEQC